LRRVKASGPLLNF
ncbi:hypothetical protein Zm00014a_042973, partial [Zea mays]